jgi:UDP-3-O-[3-hydroxymyristoyl] glucosamine N-acyltransferase
MTPDIDLLALPDIPLSELATMVDGRLDGPDRPIRHLRPASTHPPAATIGYGAGGYVDEIASRGFSAAIVAPADRDRLGDRPAILHQDPRAAFFSLHTELVRRSIYPTMTARRGTNVRVGTSSSIHEGVRIGDDVVIGDHVTIMPNTVLSDGVGVQSGSVVGEPGFQVAESRSGRYLVPHAGGVYLGSGVSIGANDCIDRAIFSTYTTLDDETMLDNLVHVAHDVEIGSRCTLTAHTELSGSVTLEDDVWLAPRTCCNQFVRFGRGAYTGTGSVVVRDVDPFTLVKGNPARPGGNVCLCRTKLDVSTGAADCDGCGRTYRVEDGKLSLEEFAEAPRRIA